jgi:hypothetical protein
MRHLSEQPLVDFVRGVSGPEVSGDIKAHLASGCSKCQTTLSAWKRVEKLAAEEGAYAPPQNLVRLVKLGFGAEVAPKPEKWTLANLIFDGFAQPLPAGVRSGSGSLSVWQVIYEAEGLSVDLRFGRRLQSKAIHLVGQVLDKQEMQAWKNAIIELLTEYDQVVATAPVSAFGEFHIEFEAKDQLWLAVKTGARNTVRIPLTNPR